MEIKIPDEFTYEYFEKNRYFMPRQVLNNIEYEAMCTNGYTKLYTIPGKIYWLVQNSNNHLTPDWKFHVSVKDSDVKKAWNTVAHVFLQKTCKASMKVKYLKENTQTVAGREITIYIPIYIDNYNLCDIGSELGFNKDIEQNEEFWFEMFDCIEKSLAENNIKSNGCANGDLPLGEYVSIRNEAFIPSSSEEIYPPDSEGFNAANHSFPFNIKRFQRKQASQGLFIKLSKLLILLSIVVFIVSIYLQNKE